ncbi:MAG: glycosyltransferase family 4 protein [Actinomycetota bacterium]|nr:glycosyltransferase family 4 protein [Actinomycetota bacterium]
MRVAIIAPPWVAVPPPAYGGTENVLDTLARGLEHAGHDVLLCTTGDSTCPVPRAAHFERAAGIAPANGGLLELRHVIAAYESAAGYDIVHDHTLAGPIYAAGFVDRPVVTTNHGPFSEGLDEYYRALAGRIPVIAISHAQARTAGDLPLAGVVHHGIDPARFPQGDGRGDYAVFLGRITASKGAHVAAQVALTAGIPLIIAGKCEEPQEIAYFTEHVKPLLGGRVEFIGEADRKTKLDLLGGARCLLNPIAWSEPFGLVMIESLACGTPVVATRQGAAPEIIDDGVTGLLADDHLGLVRAVEAAAGLDRSQCRRAAEERFSAERMVAEHLCIYQHVICDHLAAKAADGRRGVVVSDRSQGHAAG